MSGDDSDKPSEDGQAPAPIDAEGEPAPAEPDDVDPAEAPAETPPAGKVLWRRPPALLLGAVFLAALVIVGVYLARRQLDRQPIAAELPAPASGGALTLEAPEPAGTPLAGAGPAPGKILNSADEDIKSDIETIDRAASSAEGSINELPPPPGAGAIGGNADMQDAAKNAAKLFSPDKGETPAIDLSTDDPQAALQSLERAAAAQAAPDFTPNAAELESNRGADGVARLMESLEAARQHRELQAAEISRLTAEIAALKSQGAPAARLARSALAFNDLAMKVRSGAPYRPELDALQRSAGASAIDDLAVGADSGLPTLGGLKETFPAMRNAALAAARRDGAAGPLARIGANLAALVNLRPAGPVPGAGAPAILARAEARLMADDLAGAIGELEGLTGAARVEASRWTGEARRRADADAALIALNRDLLASISGERSAQ